jgi:hypothetical protein
VSGSFEEASVCRPNSNPISCYWVQIVGLFLTEADSYRVAFAKVILLTITDGLALFRV